MKTITENLNELKNLKKSLVNQLNNKSIAADENETYNTLIPKVRNIDKEEKKLSLPFYNLKNYKGEDGIKTLNSVSMTNSPISLNYLYPLKVAEGETFDVNNLVAEGSKISDISNMFYPAEINGTLIFPDREYSTENVPCNQACRGSYDYYRNQKAVGVGKIDARKFPTTSGYITNAFAGLCLDELDLSGVDFSQAKPANTLFGDDLGIVASSNIEYLNLNGATFKKLIDGTELFTQGSATGSVSKGGTGVTRIGTLDLSNLNLLQNYLNLNEIGTSIIDKVYIDGWHVNYSGKTIYVGGDYIKEVVIKNVTKDNPNWTAINISGWKYSNSGGYGFGSVRIPNIPKCLKLTIENAELSGADLISITYIFNNSTHFTFRNVTLPAVNILPTKADYDKYKDTHVTLENVALKLAKGIYLYQYLYGHNYNGNLNILPAHEELSLENLVTGFTGLTRICPKEDFPEMFLQDVTYYPTASYNLANVGVITDLDLTGFDFGKNVSIGSAIVGTGLINCTPFVNLGKGYTQKSANVSAYQLPLSSSVNLSYESLIGIINGLYDLNLTYDVANGGTLYTQKLVLGATNLAKLTAEEIRIATDKGWTVS